MTVRVTSCTSMPYDTYTGNACILVRERGGFRHLEGCIYITGDRVQYREAPARRLPRSRRESARANRARGAFNRA